MSGLNGYPSVSFPRKRESIFNDGLAPRLRGGDGPGEAAGNNDGLIEE